MEKIKCTVVGGYVGKTSLIETFTTGEFPEDRPHPTIFDIYTKNTSFKGIPVCLEILDTSATEDYRHLRPIFYNKTDVFLICFSLVSQESLKSVVDYWVHEVRRCCPETPIILVGTGRDLRNDKNFSHVPRVKKSEVLRVKSSIDAVKYIKCSAKSSMNVSKVFDSAIRAALHGRGRNVADMERKNVVTQNCACKIQ